MSVPGDGLPIAEVITARRVTLTPLRTADVEELFPLLDDDRLHGFTGGSPDTLEQLMARLEGWGTERSPDGREAWLNWIVRTTGDDRAIGTTQATVIGGPGDRSAVVGWTTGVSEQGRGYASEAAGAMVGWLQARGVGRIDAHIHPDHAASGGVARNAGLSQTDEVADGEVVWRSVVPPSADAG